MSLALENVKILDLSRALSSPFSTMILADLGAEVVKAEPLLNGDMARGLGGQSTAKHRHLLSEHQP